MRANGNTRVVSTGTLRVPYSRTERIAELIAGDVQLIQKVAKHCFVIDLDGTPIHYEENTSGTLDIIAVIGPSEHRGVSFDEMLLLEIGYGRSRPYQSAWGDARIPIHKRRSYATLTQRQLATFWPTLERLLIKIAEEKVSGWRSRHTEITTRYHIATNGHGLAQRKQKDRRAYLKGPRFSVSQQDPLVLASLLQSELATDRRQTSLMSDLEGARKFLTNRLRGYTERTLLSKKHIARLDRQSKSRVAMCVEFLRQRKFPPHHLYLILRDMPPMIRCGMESILDYTKISSEEEIECWGSLLTHNVPVLSQGFIYTIPLRRNGEDVRKVYDLKRRAWIERGSKKQNFVVFEIVPP